MAGRHDMVIVGSGAGDGTYACTLAPWDKRGLVRGLNALAATITTPLGAPVVAATRLRGGNAASARGAATFATTAVGAARGSGCTGILVVRADSAFYSAAFTSAVRPITARLIVRRVKDLNRQAAPGQDELFDVWRYYAVFTDSPFVMLQAEEQHRDHAIVEQVLADWTSGPLAPPALRLIPRQRGLAHVRS